MVKENKITLTGTYKVKNNNGYENQYIVFDSKDRQGNWRPGEFEIYIKPDIIQQKGVQPGDTIKAVGFLVFNFFDRQDGTTMYFPRAIITDIPEIEKAADGYGTQQQAQQPQQQIPQPEQPNGFAQTVPPTPGGAPAAPSAPQQAAANFNGAVPPVPPVPGA